MVPIRENITRTADLIALCLSKQCGGTRCLDNDYAAMNSRGFRLLPKP